MIAMNGENWDPNIDVWFGKVRIVFACLEIYLFIRNYILLEDFECLEDSKLAGVSFIK